MEEVIETKLLEFEKSTFLIDLIKHKGGKRFIQITQTIQFDKKIKERNVLKINPEVLNSIINALQYYQDENFSNQTKNNKEIISRYLKGVSIKDLTIQFNYKEEEIKQLLHNYNIEIVDPKPKKKYYRKT